MGRILVTLGTDNFTNWVQLPDGRKRSLGVVSPLKFVTQTITNMSRAQEVLDGFLAGQDSLFRVDEDRMEEVLRPPKRRWGAESFMNPPGMTTETSMTTLSEIRQASKRAETLLQSWSKQAASSELNDKTASDRGAALTEQRRAFYAALRELFQSIRAFDVAAEDESEEVEESEEKGQEKEAGLAYETLTRNADVAEQLLQKLAEVQGKIEAVSDKKGFNSLRAKSDVHAVVSKVAGILQDADLTQPWVAGDLAKLASRTDRIHGLFFPAKEQG